MMMPSGYDHGNPITIRRLPKAGNMHQSCSSLTFLIDVIYVPHVPQKNGR